MLARAGGLLLAALVFASSASAQVGLVFNRTGSGARAAGMANAFIAISDDGTAASWNPAGLGQLRKPELSAVSSTTGRTLGTEGFRTRDDLAAYGATRSSYQSTYLDFASLAVPITLLGKPVTFQGSWRRLYTLDYREVVSMNREPLSPQGLPPIRIDANDDLIGAVNLVSLAGAVKVTPRLAVGATVNLWRGDWTQDTTVSETPLLPPGPPAFGTTNQVNRVRGKSFAAGMLLTYPRWSVGLVYQGPLRSDFSTTERFTGTSASSATQTQEATLRFPRAFGAGVAWRPALPWTVALDLTRDNWRAASIENAEIPRVNFFDNLPEKETSTRNTISVNAGVERLFPGDGFVVPLRFGVAWEPQGPRSPYTRDPVNYTMLAAGTGYNTNSVKLDAAFQYRWAHFRDGNIFGLGESSPLLPLAVGERDNREWRLKLSLILRVTDTDKLRHTLRKVFGAGS